MADETRDSGHDSGCEASWAEGECLCNRRAASAATAYNPERGQRALDRLSTAEIRFIAQRYIEDHVGGLLLRDTVPALCDALEVARHHRQRVADCADELSKHYRHVAPGSHDDGYAKGMRRAAEILGVATAPEVTADA